MQQLLQNSTQLNKENYLIINLDEIENCTTKNITKLQNQFHLILNNKNLLINIEDNVDLKKPIYIFNDNPNGNIANKFSQLTINSGIGSRFTLIQQKNHTIYDTNIISKNNSYINYYLIQKEDQSKLQVSQHYNSFFNARLLSQQSNSNNLQVIINLLETKAVAELNILQNTKQNFTNKINLSMNHLAEGCSSITLARALAAESAKIEFNGKIIVEKCANKTHADLQTKNLIISKQASILSCPELIIKNKDVTCKHGSSTGNLNPDHLFYMQTRGLSIKEATHILLNAFLKPIIQKIKYSWILDEINYL